MDNMTSNEIRDTVGHITRELNAYRADVVVLERLKKAEAETSRLTIELDRLTAALAKAEDVEVKAERKKMRDSIRELSITYSPSPKSPNSILSGTYTISYLSAAFDVEARDTVWARKTVEGFASLDNRVMRYIMDQSPESLPTQITSLVPGNHYEAMDRFTTALRRGYFSN